LSIKYSRINDNAYLRFVEMLFPQESGEARVCFLLITRGHVTLFNRVLRLRKCLLTLLTRFLCNR